MSKKIIPNKGKLREKILVSMYKNVMAQKLNAELQVRILSRESIIAKSTADSADIAKQLATQKAIVESADINLEMIEEMVK